jgi:hypothetical protein
MHRSCGFGGWGAIWTDWYHITPSWVQNIFGNSGAEKSFKYPRGWETNQSLEMGPKPNDYKHIQNKLQLALNNYINTKIWIKISMEIVWIIIVVKWSCEKAFFFLSKKPACKTSCDVTRRMRPPQMLFGVRASQLVSYVQQAQTAKRFAKDWSASASTSCRVSMRLKWHQERPLPSPIPDWVHSAIGNPRQLCVSNSITHYEARNMVSKRSYIRMPTLLLSTAVHGPKSHCFSVVEFLPDIPSKLFLLPLTHSLSLSNIIWSKCTNV